MSTTEDKIKEAKQLSAPNLAYLGDCVLELLVREKLVREKVQKPSVVSLKYVTAEAQSAALERIIPHLSEEETDEYKRGRNDVHSQAPKHSTIAEYRRATGLEALFGYLFLSSQMERARELFEIGFKDIN